MANLNYESKDIIKEKENKELPQVVKNENDRGKETPTNGIRGNLDDFPMEIIWSMLQYGRNVILENGSREIEVVEV